MQEELVTFKTAKLAKERGFNTHCRYYFDDKDETLCENEDFPYNSWNGSIFAPTQSLLQKWLREVHGIIVEITWQMCSTDYEYAIIDMNNPPNYNDDVERIIGFKTYEEALEAGLFKALKLIKYETVTN